MRKFRSIAAAILTAVMLGGVSVATLPAPEAHAVVNEFDAASMTDGTPPQYTGDDYSASTYTAECYLCLEWKIYNRSSSERNALVKHKVTDSNYTVVKPGFKRKFIHEVYKVYVPTGCSAHFWTIAGDIYQYTAGGPGFWYRIEGQGTYINVVFNCP